MRWRYRWRNWDSIGNSVELILVGNLFMLGLAVTRQREPQKKINGVCLAINIGSLVGNDKLNFFVIVSVHLNFL